MDVKNEIKSLISQFKINLILISVLSFLFILAKVHGKTDGVTSGEYYSAIFEPAIQTLKISLIDVSFVIFLVGIIGFAFLKRNKNEKTGVVIRNEK